MCAAKDAEAMESNSSFNGVAAALAGRAGYLYGAGQPEGAFNVEETYIATRKSISKREPALQSCFSSTMCERLMSVCLCFRP